MGGYKDKIIKKQNCNSNSDRYFNSLRKSSSHQRNEQSGAAFSKFD